MTRVSKLIELWLALLSKVEEIRVSFLNSMMTGLVWSLLFRPFPVSSFDFIAARVTATRWMDWFALAFLEWRINFNVFNFNFFIECFTPLIVINRISFGLFSQIYVISNSALRLVMMSFFSLRTIRSSHIILDHDVILSRSGHLRESLHFFFVKLLEWGRISNQTTLTDWRP